MRHSKFGLIVLAFVVETSPVCAQQQPQRHLVYDFTLGMQNDTHNNESTVKTINAPHWGSEYETVHTSGNTQYYGVGSDTGTITVDVHGMRSDGGLQVDVSEVGRNYRKAAPMVCAVYPSTKIACAGQIFPEEAAVLSTLSPTFFDPARLDPKNHWRDSNDIPGLTLDFTASAPTGSVVSISEQKSQKINGGLGGNVVGNATFDYDTARRVTTNLKAYETVRPQQGEPGQYNNIIVDITATLATDSGTTAKN